jgi:hypothetical protein
VRTMILSWDRNPEQARRRHATARRGLAAALVAVAAACISLPASAQPDPFTDYDAMRSGQTPPPPLVEVGVEPLPAPSAEPAITAAPWKWSIGGRTAFSYTGISNQTIAGKDQRNTTLFFRVTPTLGVTVYKGLLVSVSVGLLGNNFVREDDRNATELAALIEFTGHYILPITKRFAFLPGLGLGPYFGSSRRALKLPDGRTVNEATSTYGFELAAYLTVGYQLSQKVELRSGLALYGLFRTEHVESANKNLKASAAHVGLPVEVHFHF